MGDQERRKRRLTQERVQRFREVRRKLITVQNEMQAANITDSYSEMENVNETPNFNEMNVSDEVDDFYQLDMVNLEEARGNNVLDDEDSEDIKESPEEIEGDDEIADEVNEADEESLEDGQDEDGFDGEESESDKENLECTEDDDSKANEENIENSDSDNESDDEVSEEEHNFHELPSEDEEWDDVTELRNWALNSNIPQTQLDRLLQILRRRLIPELPACSKTFLKTASADYHIQNFIGPDGTSYGEFVYFGIAKHLERTVNTALHQGEEVLYLQFNIDGQGRRQPVGQGGARY